MKKRGFTLIELLAVIVVLAIILAVAVPGISGIIKSASKSSFSSDAKLVLNAVRLKTLENESFNALEINKANMKELLNISDENYSSVSFEMDEDKLYVRLVGIGKWQGLIACGVYTNVNVVDDTEICGLDKQAPVVSYNPDGSTTYIKSSNVRIDISDEEINPNSLKYVWTTTETIPSDEEYINSFNSGSNIVMPTGSGIYYLHIYAKDMSENISKVFREFRLDNEIPVVTITGEIDVTIRQGTVYSDAGATANDNIDGDITDNIVLTGIVNPSVRGTYTITYTVSDTAGNEGTATRTVNVVDSEAPVITITGNNPATVNVGSSYTDAGATAIDDVDGNVTSSINTTGTVNPNVVGTYTITYTVSDTAGNVATATRTVNVIDNVAPTVAFGTNGNGAYAKTGSTTVTVSDNVGVNTGSLKYLWSTSTEWPDISEYTTTFVNGSVINTPSGVTGLYYLWIIAKDTSGIDVTARTFGFYLDNTAPVITRNGTSPVTIAQNGTYTDAGATATDAHSGVAGSVTTSGTVNTAVAGTYTITYSVSDNAGNAAAQVTRTVNVIQSIYNYSYTGGIQTFTVPANGTYKLETWGAQGSNGYKTGGKGGYASGNIFLTAGQVVYVYVGGQSGYNGGGVATNPGVYGGGATDMRIAGQALTNRVIVAGGGGGSGYMGGSWTGEYGGYGGSSTGGNGGCSSGYTGTSDGCQVTQRAYGGSQTAGGQRSAGCGSEFYATAGSLGQGGNGNSSTSWANGYGGGGGGGYYGGGGGNACGGGDGGGGGSNYVGTLTSTQNIAGNTTVPLPGGGTEIGHTGNGYARITFVNP